MKDEPPLFEKPASSMEIVKVIDAVLILYKTVRTSNDFFFDGEYELAYVVLIDALKLFRKLENNKAVAVACNNLGNTMLHLYLEMKELNVNTHAGLTKSEIIGRGTAFFHEAIKLGEAAYDKYYAAEGWTPNCLDFMQHLSNRYFNRGLFLLTIKDDHDQPQEIQKLGIRDMEISRDMDFEIVEYGQDVGFNRDSRAHKLFDVNLCRARGHNMLLDMGYPDQLMKEKGYPDEWELENLLNETFKLLQNESECGRSELFEEVSVVGRLQQIETELMRYYLLIDDLDTASKIAIRLLHEDDYVFPEAISVALEVLGAYVDATDWDETARSRTKSILKGYSRSLDSDPDAESVAEASGLSSRTEHSLMDIMSSTLRLKTDDSARKTSKIKMRAKNRMSGTVVTMEDF